MNLFLRYGKKISKIKKSIFCFLLKFLKLLYYVFTYMLSFEDNLQLEGYPSPL